MKNTLDGINSRLDKAEDQISNLEDNVAENTQSEEQKKKRIKKVKEQFKGPLDNMKCNNICITGVPEREERKQRTENLFEEIMTANI